MPFQPFDYGRAVGQGTQNALGQIKAQMAPQQFQNEMRTGQLNQMIAGLKYIRESAPMVTRETYPKWKQSLEANGISQPGELPEQYDENMMSRLYGGAEQQLKKLTFTTGTEAGPISQDYLVQGRSMQPMGKPYTKDDEVTMLDVGPEGGVTFRRGKASSLQKTTRANLEKKQFSAVDTLARLNAVKAGFKPEYQTYSSKWSALKLGISEKAGMDIGPEDKQFLNDFSVYRRNTFSNLNKTLNELSGAAVTEHEMKRLQKELPDVGTGLFDGDSPTEFKAKMDSSIKAQKRAVIRYRYALQNDMNPLKTGIELGDVDALIERRGQELEQLLLSENPNIDEATLTNLVTEQLKQEFGL